jgi:hypothetical protein
VCLPASSPQTPNFTSSMHSFTLYLCLQPYVSGFLFFNKPLLTPFPDEGVISTLDLIILPLHFPE